jgi:hypothetical protein
MKKELSAGTKDEQRTTAESGTSASLAQNGMLSEGRAIEIKRDFVRWFYSKDKTYFPTPDECFDYILNRLEINFV